MTEFIFGVFCGAAGMVILWIIVLLVWGRFEQKRYNPYDPEQAP